MYTLSLCKSALQYSKYTSRLLQTSHVLLEGGVRFTAGLLLLHINFLIQYTFILSYTLPTFIPALDSAISQIHPDCC
jgi:hypothetical protein